MRTMMLRSLHAFTLAEVLIGLVLFGLFAATLLPALSSLDKLERTGRALGRTAAVVPFQEQLIARGLNPVSNGVTSDPALSPLRTDAPAITRTAWLDRPGRVSIWRIQSQAETAGKMVAYGFQLGGGTNIDDRRPIVEPLPSVVVGAPTFTPAGPVLDVSAIDLPPATPNAPWRVRITVNSDPASRVKLRFFGPTIVSAEGIGVADVEISARDLASSASLEAWSEYAGGPGDYSETLSDGRVRWWAATADTTQLYEPSDKISRTYKIDIGAPIFTFAGRDYPSGGTVAIDWATRATAAASGASVRYPAGVNDKFGIVPFASSYNISFEGRPGSSSGDVTGFFTEDMLGYWTDTSTLSGAVNGGGAGLVSSPGTWLLTIAAMTLAVPDLADSGYDPSFYDGGNLTLSAPLLDGVRVGRVSSGSYESTGPTLTVPSSFE